MVSDLTILSVVENDPGLVELMIRSVIKFTNPPPKFIFCDNSNGKNVKRIQAAMGNHKYYEIVRNEPSLIAGSNRHGQGLDKIVPMSKTKYTAIVESDVVVLSNCWCKIDNSKYKAKGALKISNIEQLYHICFFIFDTDKLGGISFMPNNPGNNKNYKPEDDVGNQIKNKIRLEDVEPLIFIDCKTNKGKLFYGQSDEFWSVDGKLLAAHFGRGSNIKSKSIKSKFEHPRKQLVDWIKIMNRYIDGTQ